jgi:hypothetical protein
LEEELANGSYKPKLPDTIASHDKEGYDRIASISNVKYESNELLADYQNNFKKIVQLAHFYTDKVGVIKSAIRVYVTFTAGDIVLDGGQKKNLEFIEEFNKKVKMNKVVRQSTQDLYKTGNFFWYRETEGTETVWIHQFAPIDTNLKGHRRDRPIMTVSLNTDPETIPPGLTRNAIGEYSVPIDKAYHCAIDREAYTRYGKTILTPTFEPVQHMQDLMDMEKETVKEVVEFLIIFTLGDKDRPAGEKQLTQLSEKVKNLKSTSRLVGNHTLKAEAIKPDLAVFNPEKYEVPMQMLLQSLGIVPSIFTGEGSYATSSVGMQSAKQTMESARKEIVEALTDLYRDVAKEAGLNPDKNPTVSLGSIALNDEKIKHAILRDLYLDGIISAETYAAESGYDLEHEQMEIKDENSKFDIQPRQMSSTLSNKAGGRPEEDGEVNKPDQSKKPSSDGMD